MKSKYLILFAIALFLAGCDTDTATGPGGPEVEYVVINGTANALRLTADVRLTKPAAVSIEYRKAGGQGVVMRSLKSPASTEHTIPLILMEEASAYTFTIIAENGDEPVRMATASYRTGRLPEDIYRPEKIVNDGFSFDGYIYFAWKNIGQCFIFNSDGNLVWYEKTPEKGSICYNYNRGTNSVVAIMEMRDGTFCGTYLKETDLYGNVLFEAKYDELENPDMHHDVFKTPEGNYAVINQVSHSFDLSHMGGETDQRVVGDGITLLSPGKQVLWTWDCFQVMDPRDDTGILDDKGEYSYAHVDDWLHANSVITDTDGNYLISFNKLDQFWKLDGSTGKLIYRLGKGGDISIPEGGLTSHIHTLSQLDDGRIMVLDNGFSSRRTRALIYDVDENSRTATYQSVDLDPDDFSGNQASVYLMDNEHLLFGATVPGTMVVTDMDGNTKWKYKTQYPFYRAIYIPEINLNK